MKKYFIWQDYVYWNSRSYIYKDLKEALEDFDRAVEFTENKISPNTTHRSYVIQLFEISSFQVDRIFYKDHRLNKAKWLRQKGHLLKEKVYKPISANKGE